MSREADRLLELEGIVNRCAEAWATPDLHASISISFSARLRSSLGRCRPQTGRITLHASLAHEAADRLGAVLCHELAHVVAFRRHGARVSPHGPEWRALVESAGFDSSVTLAGDAVQGKSSAPRRFGYAHTCPTCHTRRLARRPVARWRCAECVAAGLTGELVVSRILHVK